MKVNVIYDQNANFTDKQKDKFNQQLLQEAKDEYGDAHIQLDVSYTAGGACPAGVPERIALEFVLRGSTNVGAPVVQSDHYHRGTMNEEQLQSILANPAVSTQHRIRAIQKADSMPVTHLEADLANP